MSKIFQFIGTHSMVIAFLFSVITYKKYRHTPMKILPIYLGLDTFVETFCFYYYRSGNVWLFNILTQIQVNFYLIILIQYLKGIQYKIVYYLLIFFNIFYVLSLVLGLNKFFEETASYGYVTGMLILLFVLVLMFRQMLEYENINQLTRNLLFWFCFSLLVFYATSLPLFSISNWGNVLGEFRINVYYMLFFAVILSQLSLIIGFLWSKKKYTY